MKAVETPEEKRARRLAKKEAKDRKRKSELGWDEEDLVITDQLFLMKQLIKVPPQC